MEMFMNYPEEDDDDFDEEYKEQFRNMTDEEVERLGESLLLLEKKMGELKDYFGLKSEDLNLDLGPLGRLM